MVNHHAAVAEVIKSMRDPVPTLETNVLGTVNVALAFGMHAKSKNKKFIFASTGDAIYGEVEKQASKKRPFSRRAAKEKLSA